MLHRLITARAGCQVSMDQAAPAGCHESGHSGPALRHHVRVTEPGGFPAYRPDPALPSPQPPREPAAGHRVGRADGVQLRVEGRGHQRSSETLLSLRLLDPAANRPLDVEVRGLTLSGNVRDGDWVEVADRVQDGRVQVSSLTNLTTGAEVATPPPLLRGRTAKVAGALVALLFLTVLAIILVNALSLFTTS
jgi:hypothetical protein